MGIISPQMVKIQVGAHCKRYEDLGYDIPKKIGYNDKIVFDTSKSLWVDVYDLPSNSPKNIGCVCDCCDKVISTPMRSYTKYNRNGLIYCHVCANKIFNSGELHTRWNPNLTDEERQQKRHYHEYNVFVQKVLARDNYTCVRCGARTNNAIVHHMNGYNWCIEERLLVSNGVTLCCDCHEKFHFKYGYGDNTKQQFDEWMGGIQLYEDYNGVIPTPNSIYCFETDNVYDDVHVCSKALNIPISGIYSACNSKSRSYNHIHLCYYKDFQKMTINERKQYNINNDINYRLDKRIVLLNTREIFNTAKEASIKYGIKYTTLSSNLIGKTNCLEQTINGKRMVFVYYEDYIKMTSEQINAKLNYHDLEPYLVCLNNRTIFYDINKALEFANLKTSAGLLRHAKGNPINKSAGRHPITNEKLIWMLYEDYINVSDEIISQKLLNISC